MIEFERFQLENGLKVIFHKDTTSPLAVVNLIYDVGARDENPDRTGFAHLFEHLMFGGSANIPNFDGPLQLAGGSCNAFTSNDITNYYDTLPVQNLETAFWLESDRMLELAFTTKSLEVQRNVVIEEFKQRYLNQPYGDVWLELRPLVYQNHPYRWATIGKKIEHIAEATMEDVKNFFYKHYGPQNAVLVIGGNTNLERVKELSEKWFGTIPSRDKHQRSIDSEPSQSEARTKTIEREVPSDAIYIAFRMGNRTSEEHYTGDLASGILSSGTSSRMYNELVVKRRMFSNISAYITGGWEDGLFVVSGQLSEEVSIADAEAAVWAEMNNLKNNPPEGRELSKVKNKIKTAKVFSEQTLMNRVLKIAMFELMGEIEEINYELNRYYKITGDDIKSFAEKVFRKENSSTLYILKSDG